MKTFFTITLAIFLIQTSALAQPVITGVNMVKVGDTGVAKSIKPGSITTTGSTGTNQLWDFSNLLDTAITETNVAIPPSAAPVQPVFATSNLVSRSRRVSLTGIDSTYTYFKSTADTLRNMGGWYQATVISYFKTPLVSGPIFPYTYGASYADSSTLVFDLGFFIDSFKYKLSYQVTGYGTLKLPGNRIYNNVLQTTYQSVQFNPSSTDTFAYVGYYVAGISYPLLTFTTQLSTDSTFGNYLISFGNSTMAPYTFNGNGNWNNPANWLGNVVPPVTLPPGSHIIISPSAGGNCTVNVPVTFPPGTRLTIQPNARLILPGNLTLQ